MDILFYFLIIIICKRNSIPTYLQPFLYNDREFFFLQGFVLIQSILI